MARVLPKTEQQSPTVRLPAVRMTVSGVPRNSDGIVKDFPGRAGVWSLKSKRPPTIIARGVVLKAENAGSSSSSFESARMPDATTFVRNGTRYVLSTPFTASGSGFVTKPSSSSASTLTHAISQASAHVKTAKRGSIVIPLPVDPFKSSGVGSKNDKSNSAGKELLVAARSGSVQQVSALLDSGAPLIQDWLGCTALHNACQYGHEDVVARFLKSNVNVDTRNKLEKTALHIAAAGGHAGIVDLLLGAGAQVNVCDFLKMTPLHWAVEKGHGDIVESLLRKKADPNIRNKFFVTAFDAIRDVEDPEIFCLIKNWQLYHSAGDVHSIPEAKPLPRLEFRTVSVGSRVDGPSASKKRKTAEPREDVGLQILKAHGIDFLPEEEKVGGEGIIASALKNGHTITLTDVGRKLLKDTEKDVLLPQTRRIEGRHITPVSRPSPSSSATRKTVRVVPGVTRKLPTSCRRNPDGNTSIGSSGQKTVNQHMMRVASAPASNSASARIASGSELQVDKRKIQLPPGVDPSKVRVIRVPSHVLRNPELLKKYKEQLAKRVPQCGSTSSGASGSR